jgi:hypothetical protein
MPTFSTTTLLEGKHLNYVKINGKNKEYQCQDLQQNKMTNIFESV